LTARKPEPIQRHVEVGDGKAKAGAAVIEATRLPATDQPFDSPKSR